MSWPAPRLIVETLLANAYYSVLLFAILAPLVWLLRHRSPQIRHALWTIVLLRLVLPPSFRLPFSAGRFFGEINDAATAALATTFTVGSFSGASTVPSPGDFVLFSAWLCGMALTAALLLRSRLQLRHLVKHATPVESPMVLEALQELRRRMGIARGIDLVTGPGAHGAFTLGTIEPVIYLPDRLLSSLSTSAIRSVLAHELSHIQRFDDLDRQLQALIQTIYFFNPVAWLAGAFRSHENELVCDGLAIHRADLVPADYGRCIVEVLRLGANPLHNTPMFLGRRRTMRQRIEAVLDTRPASRTLTIVAIAIGLFLLPMAGTSLHATLEAPMPTPNDDPIRVEGDVVEPRVVTKVNPKYPPEARSEGLQGTVIVLATIETNGTVSEIEVIESTREDFEAAAIEAVRQWKFEPATLEGKPVAVEFSLTIRFRLS